MNERDEATLLSAVDAEPEDVAQLAELGVLMASLLHELRQPMFAIRAAAQLGVTQDAEGRAEALRRVLGQLEHLEELVDHYGGLQDTRRVQPYSLHRTVGQAVQMLSHRRREVGARLLVDLLPTDVVVQGRPGAMRQVLVNLLRNALDAVSGSADRREVVLRTREEGGEIRVVVEDSGNGLGDDELARLFEPFFTTKDEGTGLGLYITRQLVEQAGGRIDVQRPAAGGTRFEVCLPRCDQPTS